MPNDDEHLERIAEKVVAARLLGFTHLVEALTAEVRKLSDVCAKLISQISDKDGLQNTVTRQEERLESLCERVDDVDEDLRERLKDIEHRLTARVEKVESEDSKLKWWLLSLSATLVVSIIGWAIEFFR